MTENQKIAFEKLCEIIKERGNEIYKEPDKIKGLLKDKCSIEQKKEINHLVTTSRESIPESFISDDGSIPKEITISRKIEQLVKEYGFNEEEARWAVEAWAKALGFIDDFSKQKILKPAPAPKRTPVPNIFEKIHSLEVNDGEVTILSGKHYEVYGNILVNKGGILKIEGSEMKFDESFGIECLGGSLNINNSNFNAINSKKGWKNIIIEDSKNNECLIENCKFENSKGGSIKSSKKISGGVITCINSDITIKNSDFIYCTMPSGVSGGALHIRESKVEIDLCNFINCSAEEGGAIFFSRSKSSVINECKFKNCASESNGGAIYSWNSVIKVCGNSNFEQCASSSSGGGIYIDSYSYANLENCEFNKCHGSAIASNNSHLFTNECTFSYCTKDNGNGGAMLIDDSTITIKSSRYINCEAGNLKDNYNSGQGGAICFSSSYASIESCEFNSCASSIGGAIRADNSHLGITNSMFQNNKSTDKGIIYIDLDSQASINNCRFNDNDGTSICFYRASDGNISKCEFENCKANIIGTENNGGAIICFESNTEIIECNFNKCESTGNGGAIYYSTSKSESIIKKCEFIMCKSRSGGAISTLKNSKISIYDCKFEKCSNSAIDVVNTPVSINKSIFLLCGSKFNEGYGGAIFINGSSLKMIDSKFEKCSASVDFRQSEPESAQNYGGAVHCNNSAIYIVNVHMDNCSGVRGGGIFSDNSDISIFSSEFSECEAEVSGGGIFFNSTSSSIASGCVFKSCKNSGIFSDNSPSTISSCRFEECTSDNGGGLSVNGEKEVIFKCDFNKCSSSDMGGGIFLKDTTEKDNSIDTCIFTDCSPNNCNVS